MHGTNKRCSFGSFRISDKKLSKQFLEKNAKKVGLISDCVIFILSYYIHILSYYIRFMYSDSSEVSSPLIVLSNKIQYFRKQQHLSYETGVSMKLKRDLTQWNTLLGSSLDMRLGKNRVLR